MLIHWNRCAFNVALPPPQRWHAVAVPRCSVPSTNDSPPNPSRTSRYIARRKQDANSPYMSTHSNQSNNPSDDLDSNLGDSIHDSPVLNSTLLNAMRDYFGDDGREVNDYTKRPQTTDGRPQFRILLAGASVADLNLARRLLADDVAYGLYFIAQQEADSVDELTAIANLVQAEVPQSEVPDLVASFSRWAIVDAVFLGSAVDADAARSLERTLADADITAFAVDVGEAITNGSLSASDALAPIADPESLQPSDEALLE